MSDEAHYGYGMLGTVTQVYGDPSYRAAEVTFRGRRTVLYWHFQFEPVEERSSALNDVTQAVMARH